MIPFCICDGCVSLTGHDTSFALSGIPTEASFALVEDLVEIAMLVDELLSRTPSKGPVPQPQYICIYTFRVKRGSGEAIDRNNYESESSKCNKSVC
jgi:hypothetical protein